MTNSNPFSSQLSIIYKQHAGQVLATLIRLIKDFDLAEEAMHEAFTVAVEKWEKDGIPEQPSAWLISTARFKAIDIIRRKARFSELETDLQQLIEEIEGHNSELAERDIEDDQLRLIFTCCHPAIDPKIQIPLTLREVCGLTTEEIASAFLVPSSTMAQRIVRGKAKIRDAKIPYSIPSKAEFPERLDAVLSVIYLVFNEGYSASSGDSHIRADLSNEAIRLTRRLLQLHSDPEIQGLLALMLLHESRRLARTDEHGDIILLENQDRNSWDQTLIEEGTSLVKNCLNSNDFGFYTLQAAISACHGNAATAANTDWNQIVGLYENLLAVEPSPVIELNMAVAIAMRDGPEAGLTIIDRLLKAGDLEDYHLCHSTQGELLRRAGRFKEASIAFEKALSLTKQAPEQRMLRRKLKEIQSINASAQ